MHRARNEFIVNLIDFDILNIKALNKSFFVNIEEKDVNGNTSYRNFEVNHEVVLMLEYSKYGNLI